MGLNSFSTLGLFSKFAVGKSETVEGTEGGNKISHIYIESFLRVLCGYVLTILYARKGTEKWEIM